MYIRRCVRKAVVSVEYVRCPEGHVGESAVQKCNIDRVWACLLVINRGTYKRSHNHARISVPIDTHTHTHTHTAQESKQGEGPASSPQAAQAMTLQQQEITKLNRSMELQAEEMNELRAQLSSNRQDQNAMQVRGWVSYLNEKPSISLLTPLGLCEMF